MGAKKRMRKFVCELRANYFFLWGGEWEFRVMIVKVAFTILFCARDQAALTGCQNRSWQAFRRFPLILLAMEMHSSCSGGHDFMCN